jgi:hypothetical protein
MHGTVHPLDEPFASHPNCRCQATPITKTWAELGFTGIPDLPEPEPGSAVFARLSEAEQRQILGPGKLELFKAGKLELRDLVAVTNSRVWGKGRRERTLREVLSA